MVSGMSLPLLDGHVGSSLVCGRSSIDQRGSTLPVLQLVRTRPSNSLRIFANDLSIISFLGTVAIALSLAEIASIWPTAGGQYHWVAVLAPRNARVTASWFTGWISVGGQIVLTASAAFAAGLQLQALITLNHPDTYVPKRWQGMLFYWLVLLYAAAVNILGSKILPHTNLASGESHGINGVGQVIL